MALGFTKKYLVFVFQMIENKGTTIESMEKKYIAIFVLERKKRRSGMETEEWREGKKQEEWVVK